MSDPNRQACQEVNLLLQAIAQQNAQALLALYQLYSNLVYSLALQIVHESCDAEEITQDVFLKLWRHPERWNPEFGQFSSWLLTITRNASIDHLRRQQRSVGRAFCAWGEFDEPCSKDDISNSSIWYDGQVLRRLLIRLPEEQRFLVELAFYEGFSHSELAARLCLPLGTVKTRLRMGLQKLRVMWAEEERLGEGVTG